MLCSRYGCLQWSAKRDDEAGVGVDDDLMVGRVPIVLGLLGDFVITGGNQGAIHDEHRVLGESAPWFKPEEWPEPADDAVRC